MKVIGYTDYATKFMDDEGNEHSALGHYDSYEEYQEAMK